MRGRPSEHHLGNPPQSSKKENGHMDTCKSINYAGPGKVDLVEAKFTDPNPGEVQIQGLACGVCAWDVHCFKNGVDWPVWPGHEGVGQVVKVGAGVTKFKEGDWVTGVGCGFTEIYNKGAHELYAIP